MYDKSISHISRKNPVVITLVQTPFGYSVQEGLDLINKSATNNIPAPPKDKPSAHPPIPKRQNVIIPLYPYTNSKVLTHEQKHLTLPSCAAWFNYHAANEIERKALPEWFRAKKGLAKTDRYEKSEELYLKYRNYIVDLGKGGYVSATKARKGLAGDACSIMRIHAFLEHWGIINNYSLKGQVPTNTRELIMRFDEDQKLDLFDYDKKLISKSYSQEDAELLRRATKKYRPLCDFCTQRCGIVWFEHKRALTGKEVSQIMKSVNPRNPTLSSTEYEISLCLKCFSDGNFPIIFTSHDFNKITIEERLEEINKTKKKNKEKEKEPNSGMDLEWSLSEIDKMLSLAQKHGNDWEAISKELDGRTPEDALICFLTLPIKNVSKIRFEHESTQFVKENSEELVTNFSDNICVSALEQMEKLKADFPSTHFETQPTSEDYSLFEQMVRLQLQRASLKLSQLQEWQSLVHTEKKQVEQGRKAVIAEKLRSLASGL